MDTSNPRRPGHGWSGFTASEAFVWFGWLNVWLAVALLIIRGLPVIFDAIPYIQQSEPDLTESSARPGATEP